MSKPFRGRDRSRNSTSYEPINNLENLSNKPISQFDTTSTHLRPKTIDLQRRRFRRAVVDLWLLEWFAWFLALAAIAAIVGVLVAFKGKPIPDWPYGISLSALVSVLATIATISLGGPIAAGLGQARWMWFSKERCMEDFEVIDEASKGPIGAGLMVICGKGGLFAIFGALLLIITQGVGPFAQQVVRFETRAVGTSAAAVPTAEIYDTFATDDGDVSLSMKAAVQRGILDVSAKPSTFFVNPQCPTGNCTWPPYTSLSVCGRCSDVSSRLTVSNVSEGNEVTTSLPNNISLTSIPATTGLGLIAMTVNTTSNQNDLLIDSLEYAEWDWPVLDVFTVIAQYGGRNNNEKLMGPFASECILQFCVQNFSASSTNGTFVEKPKGDPVYLNGTYTFEAEIGGTNYSLDYETFKALSQNYLEDMFNTVTKQQNGLSATSQWTDDVSQSLFYWTNRTDDHLPTTMFENIAASMSLNVRSTSNLSSDGSAYSQQSIVAVNWLWMILPFALLALVGIYLVSIVVATRRMRLEPWKTSSLAVLMHGLADAESRSLVAGAEALDQMERVAKSLRLKVVQEKAMSDDGSSESWKPSLVAR